MLLNGYDERRGGPVTVQQNSGIGYHFSGVGVGPMPGAIDGGVGGGVGVSRDAGGVSSAGLTGVAVGGELFTGVGRMPG